MDFLYNRLPKDLVNIIEEYAKDRTQYDKVIKQFEKNVIKLLQNKIYFFFFIPRNECYCTKPLNIVCGCETSKSFEEIKKFGCYESHMNLIETYDLFQLSMFIHKEYFPSLLIKYNMSYHEE